MGRGVLVGGECRRGGGGGVWEPVAAAGSDRRGKVRRRKGADRGDPWDRSVAEGMSWAVRGLDLVRRYSV